MTDIRTQVLLHLEVIRHNNEQIQNYYKESGSKLPFALWVKLDILQEPRDRNPDILVSIPDHFEGTLSQYEDSFGYLSGMDDDEMIEHIRAEYKNAVVMRDFDQAFWRKVLPQAPDSILKAMLRWRKEDPEAQRIKYNAEVVREIENEIARRKAA